MDRAEELRDNLSRQLDYVPRGPTDYVIGQLYTGLVTTDMSYRMAKKSLTMEEDKGCTVSLQCMILMLSKPGKSWNMRKSPSQSGRLAEEYSPFELYRGYGQPV